MIFDAEVGEYYCSEQCEEADLESESDEWGHLFDDEYEIDAFEQANEDMNARLYGEYQDRRS